MGVIGKIVLGTVATLVVAGVSYIAGYNEASNTRFGDLDEFEAIQVRDRMKNELRHSEEQLAVLMADDKNESNREVFILSADVTRLKNSIELLNKKLKDYDAKQAAKQQPAE